MEIILVCIHLLNICELLIKQSKCLNVFNCVYSQVMCIMTWVASVIVTSLNCMTVPLLATVELTDNEYIIATGTCDYIYIISLL